MKGKKKKLLLLVSCITVFALLIGAGGTIAYLSANDTLTNLFEPGGLSVDIVENGEQTGDKRVNPIEGTGTFEKRMEFLNPENPHEIDAYIRAALLPVWRMADGTGTGTPVSLTEPWGSNMTIDSGEATVTLTFADNWRDAWVYQDGYFYCKQVIAPGAKTPPLLISVTITNAPAGQRLDIEGMADAIQATRKAVADAWGEGIAAQLEPVTAPPQG